MLAALLAILVSGSASPLPPPILRISPEECPKPAFDRDVGMLGGRAIVADDGLKMVVQCGDGTIRLWEAGNPKLRRLDRMPLFRAAKLYGLVDPNLHCPWPAIIANMAQGESDCDIVDRAGSTYVLRNVVAHASFIVTPKGAHHELTIWQSPGGVQPKDEAGPDIFVVDSQNRPEEVQILSGDGLRKSVLVRLPSPNLIFEDGEGKAEEVVYAPANNVIILSFGGVFRAAEDMTYVRALTPDGKEQWNIRGRLPKRDESLIVGDFAKVCVFSGGKYALFSKRSAPFTTDIIRLNDGSIAARIAGHPIAVTRTASRILIAERGGDLVFIDVGSVK